MSGSRVEGARHGQPTGPGTSARRPAAALTRVAPFLIVIAAIAIQAFRLRDALGRSLWAEDGQIFLTDALRLPLSDAIVHPYAGYMHLIPRLIGGLAAALPLTSAPWVMSAGALLACSLIALFVFYASAALVESVPIRVVLALLIPLLPAGQEEVFGVVANIHWFLNIACFFALVQRPASGRRAILPAIVVAIAVLCDPMAVLLLPVALARGYVSGWRTVRWPIVALVAAGAVQAIAVLNGRDERPFARSASIVDVIAQYWVGVAGRALGGGKYVVRVDGRGVTLALIATVLLLGLLLWAWRTIGDLSVVAAGAGIMAAGLPLFVAVTYLTGIAPQRYAVGPIFLIYVGVAFLLDRMLRTGDSISVGLAAVAGVLIAVIAVLNAPINTPLTTAVPWRSRLDSTAPACATGRALIRVATTPDGWFVQLSCRQLQAAVASDQS